MDVLNSALVEDLFRRLKKGETLSGDWILLPLSLGMAVILVGQLQLALRHPQNNGPPASDTRNLVRQLIDVLSGGSDEIRAALEADNDWVFGMPGSGG